ncbi:MAG TPA: zf-HC2 domain-containing protein, partial [Vicinamibacterales bacterium]|nr:zf-HC2 domain-containing protein [Vicinamibacterales bacterium]
MPPRLLRETLLDPPAPASSTCLDADTLAAWFDGTLSKSERKMAESHLSTCARCQAVLAATARTSVPPPAP